MGASVQHTRSSVVHVCTYGRRYQTTGTVNTYDVSKDVTGTAFIKSSTSSLVVELEIAFSWSFLSLYHDRFVDIFFNEANLL
jgi:hypothetical protein